ncbi:fatty acid desaturase [Leucothrix arctica]|uniref:Fatty acid desaturase n=1 Tax=Leucothrix arctica TaxID=1481894 RepID=A0A317CJ58_9GAMM|nr:fatty acid desaturase [Leucothrix arctica]PWQ97463.1 fatty acid desaturase [Leucothrix arctica]
MTSHTSANPTKPNVSWADLRAYKHWEIIKELSLPLPWLALSLWATSNGWYPVTIIAAFYFFLTGLRVTHNAFHYCLGLSKLVTDCVMFVLSVLMLGSLHAVQYTHLLHHRHCLTALDVEGAVAKQGFWETLYKGPLFPIHTHKAALVGSKGTQKRWIKLELLANILWLCTIWFWWDNELLQVHSVLMLVAYCFSAFFAVWTVHHDCDHESWDNSRTLRSQWKCLVFYNMFYHIEHHLYPQVPTCHLPELAKRLDAAGYTTHKRVI